MINIKFVTVPGCYHCERAREIFSELKSTYPDMEIVEVDVTTPEGAALVSKYEIFSSPGIIINDELFSTGGLDKEKFIQKLHYLKGA